MQQSTSKVQWKWKSNPNPFTGSEKAQWTAYSQSENEKLEEAYQNQQKEVDLGVYIISIQDMIQKKKDNIYKQRPIRRNLVFLKEDEVDQEDELREKRFFGAETPKTFNKAFGSLQDYLKFFENRGQKMREFANLFNEVEANNDIIQLNHKILPSLIHCIQAESMKTPNNKTEKKLLPLFQEEPATMEQFYARVLKAYTIESFLYKNMNLYLRNEDWTQLDPLLPYAYCLCKAFFCRELVSNSNNIQIQPANLPGDQEMILYRGASLDEATLSFYDQNIVKNFSWNAVTSTSRKRDIAQKFMEMDKDPSKPIPVLFIIKVPLLSFEKEKATKWIDIQQHSAAPQEDEVILPPGSIFELTGVSRDELGAEIRFKLILDVEKLAHQGQVMHGAMLSEMAQDNRFKFVCLEGKELTEAITHLKGNQVIEELEFCLCSLDEKVGVSLAETLEKMPRMNKVIFASPLGVNQSHWSVILENLEKVFPEGLEIVDDVDLNQLDLVVKGIRNLTSLTSLTLNFRYSDKVTDEGLRNLSCQGLKHLTSLRSLVLDFRFCNKITNEGLKSLCFEGLKHLTSLTSLALNFSCCFQISDEGLKILSFHGIQHLTLLVSLTIDLSECSKITEEELNYSPSRGIKHLTSLTSLTLNFQFCKVSDKVLKNLWSQGVTHLALLTSLSLDFQNCFDITDKGLNNLSSQGLRHLTSLRSLTVSFRSCHKITDEGLNNLWHEGIRNFTSLESLTLNFGSCSEITDKGLNDLCQKGIKPLTSLSSLALHFDDCKKISSDGKHRLQEFLKLYNQTPTENHGSDKNMTFLRKLEGGKIVSPQDLLRERAVTLGTTIILNTGEKLESFVENRLPGDNEREILAGQNSRIDGRRLSKMEEMSWCMMEIAHSPTSIVSLTLDMGWSEITNEGLQHFCCKGLQHLISLTSLTLSFICCSQITDEGLLNLGSQGLKYLASLTSLTLNLGTFAGIRMKITDEGLYNLSSQGLKYLTSLSSLNLDFSGWSEVTDTGVSYLCCEGIEYLTHLTSLTLSFLGCERITDKTLDNLCCQGLNHLKSLLLLNLNFRECHQITNEGLNILCSKGVKCLTSLVILYLDIRYCPKVKDMTWNNFHKVLKYFGYQPSKDDTLNPSFSKPDQVRSNPEALNKFFSMIYGSFLNDFGDFKEFEGS